MTLRLRLEHAPKIYTQAVLGAYKFYGGFENCTFDQIGIYIAKYVQHKFDEIEKNPETQRRALDIQRLLPLPNEVVFDFENSKITGGEQ